MLRQYTLQIKPKNATDYPLTPNQLALLYTEDKLGKPVYNMVLAFEIHGSIELNHFLYAIKTVVEHHTIFHTGFNKEQNRQFIVPQVIFDTTCYTDKTYSNEESKKIIAETQETPFDFKNPPLARSVLIKTEKGFYWTFVVHSTIFDGISRSIFLQQVSDFYNTRCKGETFHLPSSSVNYPDFCAWEEENAESLKKDHLDPWNKYLEGNQFTEIAPTLDNTQEYNKAARHTFMTSSETYSQINALAKQYNLSDYVVLLSIFTSFIYHYTQQPDVTIASVTANRAPFKGQLEDALGYFANTVLIRNTVDPNKTFKEFTAQVKEHVTEYMYKHSGLSFARLASTKHNNLFQIMFAMEPDDCQRLNLNGLDVSPVDSVSFTPYDLTCKVRREKNVAGEMYLAGFLEFDIGKFNSEFIRSFINNFLFYLDNVLANPDIKLGEIDYFSEEEKHKQNELFPKKDSFDAKKGIHQYFEDQASLHPENIAVVFDDKKITYAELNAKANQLAYFLMNNGVTPGSIVAITLPYSIELIVSLLGILKAGAIVLFLEHADTPAARELRARKIGIAEPKMLISREDLSKLFSDTKIPLVLFDESGNLLTTIAAITDKNPTIINDFSEKPAVITFTSGTTGTPKGVIASHDGLSNWKDACTPYVEQSPNVNASAPPTFDAFTWEALCVALGNGKTLFMMPFEQRLDVNKLKVFFNTHHISLATFTPTFLRQLNPDDFPSLKQLFLVGEKLSPDLIAPWLKRGVKVTNGYGPSEVTVGATKYDCELEKPVCIGKPIQNMYVLILDPITHQAVPFGVWGEIAIGGVGVTEYLKNPELTKQKFIPNPFFPDKFVYLSGDSGRYNLEGNLECRGRLDRQIKLAGVRIEPEEIESKLMQVSEIAGVYITTHTSPEGFTHLIAYVQIKENSSIPPNYAKDLTKWLHKEGLPLIKIPQFCFVRNFPLTTNGKVDEKELNRLSGYKISIEISPAVTETQQQVQKLIQDLQGLYEPLDINTSIQYFGVNSFNVLLLKATLIKLAQSKIPKTVDQSELVILQTSLLSEGVTIQSISDTIDSEVERLSIKTMDKGLQNARLADPLSSNVKFTSRPPLKRG